MEQILLGLLVGLIVGVSLSALFPKVNLAPWGPWKKDDGKAMKELDRRIDVLSGRLFMLMSRELEGKRLAVEKDLKKGAIVYEFDSDVGVIRRVVGDVVSFYYPGPRIGITTPDTGHRFIPLSSLYVNAKKPRK